MDRIFRLLLVDDEPHVTGALSLQLEAREDLDVYVSNSAAGALDVLRRTRIDLMVSDIRMPGMTGAGAAEPGPEGTAGLQGDPADRVCGF